MSCIHCPCPSGCPAWPVLCEWAASGDGIKVAHVRHKGGCPEPPRPLDLARSAVPPSEPAERPPAIFVNGGLGDVLLLESWMPDSVRTIAWACRGRPDLQPILERVRPEVRHVNLWGGLSDDGERYRYNYDGYQPDDCPAAYDDWSIFAQFPRCRDGRNAFRGSSLLKRPIADVARFGLPERYVVTQHDTPYNSPGMRANRRLAPDEWDALLARVEREGRYCVVVDAPGAEPPPPHRLVIDLTGRTTYAESVEILKGAAGYYGIDSTLSILAAQHFDRRNLWVRWHGDHFQIWKDLYLHPQRPPYEFIADRLGEPPAYPPTAAESIDLARRMNACPFYSRDRGCGCNGGRCGLKGSRNVSHLDCFDCLRRYP